MAQLDLLNDTVLAADFAAAPLSVPASAPKEAAAKEKSPEAMRTISEVAAELGEETHVLRFWETRFPQVQPVKMKGGRRHYRPADVLLLRTIRTLLHERGYTIKGAQAVLAAHKNPLDALNAPAIDDAPEATIIPGREVVAALKAATETYDAQTQEALQNALAELKEMRTMLLSSERSAAR